HATSDLVEPEIVEAADEDNPDRNDVEVRTREVVNVSYGPSHPPELSHNDSSQADPEQEEAHKHSNAVNGEPDGTLHVAYDKIP
ncbi:hypothetical protein, partial [Escherichia coli]|uniref:hypothetical protein n=1 Tax=Escherichia coli TaxID=562 RepID=UPI001BDCFFEB